MGHIGYMPGCKAGLAWEIALAAPTPETIGRTRPPLTPKVNT
jgi:hypothetical protein